MSPYSSRRLPWAGPAATLAAILVDVLYYFASKAAGESYLIPFNTSGSQPVPLPILNVIMAVLVSGLIASLFFGALLRFSRKPATVFLSVAITALILSFGGPFNLPDAAMQTKLLLSGMHLLAAAIITGGILFLSHEKTIL